MRRVLALALLALCLAGCGGGETKVEQGNRLGILHYGNGQEPQGLDPHAVGGNPENNIIRTLFEGLVNKHPETLAPQPGVAERWDISADRRTYTFFLRGNARWSNGDPVTAQDYVWSWHRALHPKTGNRFAYMLYPIRNAEKFSTGKLSDFDEVGVRALDERTLEVTLEEPTPYFLQLMDHYSAFAVHPETILAHGAMTDKFTQWTRPEHFVGNGAFVLDEWRLSQKISVRKNPLYWDADAVALNGIVFYPTENSTTEERMFRANQLHITATTPVSKVPEYLAQEPSPLVISPYLGTFFLWVNLDRAPGNDLRVRRALALSIDRDRIARSVMKETILPFGGVVPAGIPDYDYPEPVGFDPETARTLLAEAGFPNGEGWPGLDLSYPSSDAGRNIMVAIQQMWKEHLNIEVTLSNREWKVHVAAMDERDYELASLGWVADYVDPITFLTLFTSDAGYNAAGYSNPEFDQLVMTAASEAATPEARLAALSAAEQHVLADLPVLPLYVAAARNLVHPSVGHYYSNVMDEENLRYVTLSPDAPPLKEPN